MNKEKFRNKIIKFAKKQDFTLVGFTEAKISKKDKDAYNKWIKKKYNGQMNYMENKNRINIKKILPDAKSVIVLGLNYYHKQPLVQKGYGKIARYAYGKDYHKIIKKKLKNIENFIKLSIPEAKTKSYVDTGPVMERALAQQAKLGHIGKNSCLITREFGSWVFLSVIITNIELVNKKNSQKNGKQKNFPICGLCNRCIKACPTGAISSPGVVDSRLCISYLTIENKNKIPEKLKDKIKKTSYLFGCDICQEVCPHNEYRQKPASLRSLKTPKIAGDKIDIKKINKIRTEEQYLENFKGSPLMRTKLKGLQRNAKILT